MRNPSSHAASTRMLVAFGALLCACVFVFAAGHALSGGLAKALLDFPPGNGLLPYPVTIQNIMWVMFFFGCGELLVRHLQGMNERRQLSKQLLPEDASTMLRAKDLGAIYHRVQASAEAAARPYFLQPCFLQRLILRASAQFQSSRSIDQANALMNSTLELYQHEIELRYNMLRYLVWVIPTLGFIGTVVGIALALESAAAADDLGNPEAVKAVIAKLGVAFYTTLLALLQSMALVFVMHLVQGREEGALNDAGQYCLDNLINRLYEK
ncbi:MAG: MotA/TolQ/ExbB proton channel family protein [Gammaproteobacteria bacterium]|nr:MotA/TolQ/ExbB proton channel family protein [Gammaproteobacteria bacterium]MDD9883159.1 MotA/TolQ/ExbB proton channel family protein [Gammaproteobacteria bacterium]